MTTQTSSSFLQSLNGEKHSSIPIWLMRQAGRYLPEYQKIKAHASLWELFHNPEAIVEITCLPLKVLPLDAAILFTDIMTVANGLGIKWDLPESGGPRLLSPIRSFVPPSIYPVAEAYGHIQEAISSLKKVLTVPLIGFSGGPLTVASYLIEGKGDPLLPETKKWMYTDPQGLHKFLDTLTRATIEYLLFQIKAGVDAIQIFESNALHLSVADFQTYALPYLQKIVEALRPTGIPIILFARGSSLFGDALAALRPTALSLDWQVNLSSFRQKHPHPLVLQGNLDPAVLLGTKEELKRRMDLILSSMHQDPAFIFNLGHGILPQTPFDSVRLLVDYVRNYR